MDMYQANDLLQASTIPFFIDSIHPICYPKLARHIDPMTEGDWGFPQFIIKQQWES